MATRRMPPKTTKHEALLGVLAMRFRGTHDSRERKAIGAEYAKTVKKLIKGGNWNEMPAPEDQLPDDAMPKEFFEFWSTSWEGP
jgi:hypothetical protein